VPPPRPLAVDPIDQARENWVNAGWARAAGGMSVLTSVVRVSQILVSEVDAVLRPLGLTFARYEVLMLLRFSRAGELPLGKMGERLQVHPASVTNAVDRLEADGLVRRQPHPSDGRGVLAAITPAGRRRAAAASDQLNAVVFERVELPGDGLDTLYALLKDLRHRAGDFV
jgi:DNA-binding MarR family transcriptional regulator